MKNSRLNIKAATSTRTTTTGLPKLSEADLRSFYEQGYRMMRLTDFVDGNIDVAFSYNALILTFDDGIEDVVLEGWNDDGTPKFDPGCAIAILER